jgi:lipopolysaccharide export system permease protein
MRLGYTLSKYLITVFVKWLLVSTVVLGFIFGLIDLMEMLRRLSTKADITFLRAIKMFFYRYPSYFQEILPFVVLFAAVAAFWHLNKKQELVVIRLSGISVWQILTPLMGAAFIIGLLDMLILNPLAAKLLNRFYTFENQYIYQHQTPFSISEEGFWLREQGHNKQVILHAKHFDENQKALYNLTLYLFDGTDHFLERYDARLGTLKNKSILLNQGWHTPKDGVPEKFTHQSIDTSLTLQSINESFLNPKTLTFYTLRSYGHLMEKSGLSALAYFVQWHTLVSRCIWFAVMVMLAATFAIRYQRARGGVKMIGFGIALAFFLYFLRDITYALGMNGELPPVLAAWVPTLVTGLFAATKLLYSEDG